MTYRPFFVVVVVVFNNSLYENEKILLLKQSKLESDVLSKVCEVYSWGSYSLCRFTSVSSFIKSALRVSGEVLDTFHAFKGATITYWFITCFRLFTWLRSYSWTSYFFFSYVRDWNRLKAVSSKKTSACFCQLNCVKFVRAGSKLNGTSPQINVMNCTCVSMQFTVDAAAVKQRLFGHLEEFWKGSEQ